MMWNLEAQYFLCIMNYEYLTSKKWMPTKGLVIIIFECFHSMISFIKFQMIKLKMLILRILYFLNGFGVEKEKKK